MHSQAGKQLLCCVNSDRKLPGCGDTHPLALPPIWHACLSLLSADWFSHPVSPSLSCVRGTRGRCRPPVLLTQSTLQTFIFNYCWVRAERWIINRKPGLFLAGGPLLWHSPEVRLRWWNPFATQNLSLQLPSQLYTNKTHRRYLLAQRLSVRLGFSSFTLLFTSVHIWGWVMPEDLHPSTPFSPQILGCRCWNSHSWWACFAKHSLTDESSSSLPVFLEGGSRWGQGGANSDSPRIWLSSLPPCLLFLLKET